MKVENSLSNLHGKPSPLFPGDVVVFVLEIGPQRPFGTIFQYYAIVRLRGDCSQEHNDAGMAHSLHGMTFTQKIS